MNLDKLFTWVVGVVLSFALVGKLDVLQLWIWKAQAKLIRNPCVIRTIDEASLPGQVG